MERLESTLKATRDPGSLGVGGATGDLHDETVRCPCTTAVVELAEQLLPFGADDVRVHLALLSSLLAVLFPGADRVSARAELTRLLLTTGATEGVDLTR